MKLNDILSVSNGLQALGTQTFPAKTAYAIARNMRFAQPFLESFEEARKGIIKKYAKAIGDAAPEVQPQDMETVQAELKSVIDTDEEINFIDISINDLGDAVQPNVLAALMPILKE